MLFLQKTRTMKKQYILKALMLLITVALVLFTSCKKDPISRSRSGSRYFPGDQGPEQVDPECNG